MTDTAPRPDGPLLRRTTADPSTSLLITGLASAAVLRADGELRAPRETRGGTVEWGGVYAQGVRLTGPWTMTGEIAGASYDLPSTLRSLSAERWRVDSEHRWGSALVRQRIECLPSEPGVARSLELSAAAPLPVRIRQRIQPFLAPVLAEGIKPYVYRIRRRGLGLEARAYGSLGVLSPSIPASQWRIDGHDWTGGEV
ncbi:MAG: hypothetical protein L3J91_02575 [Thermoplasmata archaeon]|nr:hypothetical protein [Thermoplasmata archaeon]